MKKGIILEQHRKYTILLTKDGSFEKGIVLEKTAEVGEEVNYKPLKKSFFIMKMDLKHTPLRILSIACICMLLFIPFYFFPTEQTYAYVTVDINPSVEIEIDEEYMVQSIRPVNADASLVTEQLEAVKNRALEDVIQMIIHKSEEMALVNEDKNVLVGISFFNDEANNKRDIIHEIEEQVADIEPDWNFAMFHVPKEIRVLADETKTSMNKILANQFAGNDDTEQEFHAEYVIDDEEMEFISSFYQPKNNDDIEAKKIEIMSEPNNDTLDDDKEQIEVHFEDEELSNIPTEDVPALEGDREEAKDSEEIKNHFTPNVRDKENKNSIKETERNEKEDPENRHDDFEESYEKMEDAE